MPVLKFVAKASCYLLVLLLAGLWLKPQAAFSQLPINKVPWSKQLTHTSVDEYHIERTENGSYQISFTTDLKGVSPKMLYWFYQNQADKSARIDDQKHTWYQLSHPMEHSEIEIVESPDPHSDKLMSGTVFYQKEIIGTHELNIKYRIKSFGEEGMSFDVMHSGYVVGQFNYEFTKQRSGTEIALHGQLGLDVPVIGHLSNFYLFNKVFPSFVIEDWVEHILESFDHKQVLIPKLYSQKSTNKYTIS